MDLENEVKINELEISLANISKLKEVSIKLDHYQNLINIIENTLYSFNSLNKNKLNLLEDILQKIHLLKAEEYDKQSSPCESNKELNEAILLNHFNEKIYPLKIRNYLKLKKINCAIKDYKYLINIKIKNAICFFFASVETNFSYYNLLFLDKALMSISKAISRTAILEQDNENEFLKLLSLAVKINPSNHHAYSTLAMYYFDRKNYYYAVEFFGIALQFDKNNIEYYNNRGNAYYFMKDMERALKDYKKGKTLKCNCDRITSNIGNIYYQKCDYENALKFYKEAIKINPKKSNHYFNASLVFYCLKDQMQAKSYFYKAIALSPEKEEEYFNRGAYLFFDKEYYS